jgi:hypothetical protein
MFWNIEDIQYASTEAQKLLGSNGRMIMLNTAKVVSSAVLYTQEHGKIWYGDIDLGEDGSALERLSASLEMPVFVLVDTTLTDKTPIDVTDAVAVATKQGLQILRNHARAV